MIGRKPCWSGSRPPPGPRQCPAAASASGRCPPSRCRRTESASPEQRRDCNETPPLAKMGVAAWACSATRSCQFRSPRPARTQSPHSPASPHRHRPGLPAFAYPAHSRSGSLPVRSQFSNAQTACSPLATTAFTFLLMTASVSPSTCRRSLCPRITDVQPQSVSISTATSPVKAPGASK